jgi:nitrite reductase/ring-hydroxylating ferredoxin subunit
MAATQRIAALEAVSGESTVLFRVADDLGDEREAILVGTEPDPETGDGVACWLNYCQHFTHIKLDKGDGAPMRDGEVICANHGAYFDSESGECTFGPCEGAYLTELDVAVVDGAVLLVDDEYEYVGPGPVDDDDGDLTSTSNVEF